VTENRAGEFAGSMPFADLIGIEITSVTADQVVAHLDWAPERCTAGGTLHGGVIMSLADTVGGLAAFVNLPDACIGAGPPSWSRPMCETTRTGCWPGSPRPRWCWRAEVAPAG